MQRRFVVVGYICSERRVQVGDYVDVIERRRRQYSQCCLHNRIKNSGASLDISARVGNMLIFVMSALSLSLSWRPPGLTMSRGYVHRTTQIMSSSVSGSLESSSEARATLPRSSPMRLIIRSDMAKDPSYDVNCAAISSEDSNRPCCMFNLTRDMRWRSSERAAVRNSCEYLGSTFPYSTAKGRKHSEDCNSRSSRISR